MRYLYLYYSWIFPGTFQNSTDSGSVNTLNYDQISPVSGGDRPTDNTKHEKSLMHMQCSLNAHRILN